jgi:hypothetical protein
MERDRFGVPFEDDLTENRGAGGAAREEQAETETFDPDVDSQEDDDDMARNVFGVDDPAPKTPPA